MTFGFVWGVKERHFRLMPKSTATEVAEELRRWLARRASKPTTAEGVTGRSLTPCQRNKS